MKELYDFIIGTIERRGNIYVLRHKYGLYDE